MNDEEEEDEKEVIVDEVFLMKVVFELEENEDEYPAEGTMTARNSSWSISPSPFASPRAKIESTSIEVSFAPLGSVADFSSSLLRTP